MVSFNWAFGVVSVAFGDCVEEVFATKDIIDSSVIAHTVGT